uniref:Uncharacterized protein n=1 Tax=Opuntia streptacantha TaxID=393608 RepID=A0A7C9EZK3_OPUST
MLRLQDHFGDNSPTTKSCRTVDKSEIDVILLVGIFLHFLLMTMVQPNNLRYDQIDFCKHVSCLPFFMDIVQRRSESDWTVTVSPVTMLDVLTKPPNFISVSVRFHFSPEVVLFLEGIPIGMSPQ